MKTRLKILGKMMATSLVISFFVVLIHSLIDVAYSLHNDSSENAALQRECDSLQTVLSRLQSESKALFLKIDSLKTCIEKHP